MNSVCFSPVSVQQLIVIVDCSFEIEEFPNKMAISSSEFQRKNHLFSENCQDSCLSSAYLITLFPVVSSHLVISVSHAQLHSSTWFHCDLPRISSFTLSLYPFCPRHNSRRRSLSMLVLSHSDTHHLNGYMAWCGCHEILIQH